MNKKPFLLLILVFVLVSFLIFRAVSFFGKQQERGEIVETETFFSSGVLQTPSFYEQWKPFHSDKHAFVAKFPSKVDFQAFAVVDPRSKEKQSYDIFASQELDSTAYVINVIQFPPEANPQSDSFLIESKIQDIVANGLNSHLVSSKKTHLFGQDTTEFVIEGEKFHIRGAMFIFANKLYILSMTSSKKDDSEKDWEYFVKSFSLNKVSQ